MPPSARPAETASVFGEALTFDRIMSEEKDPKVRLAMLCTQCEDAFSTVFRQVAFNRYEDACHTIRRKEGELAAEQLGEVFQEKLQAMFGDSLILTDEHKVWWSYVSHAIRPASVARDNTQAACSNAVGPYVKTSVDPAGTESRRASMKSASPGTSSTLLEPRGVTSRADQPGANDSLNSTQVVPEDDDRARRA